MQSVNTNDFKIKTQSIIVGDLRRTAGPRSKRHMLETTGEDDEGPSQAEIEMYYAVRMQTAWRGRQARVFVQELRQASHRCRGLVL